MSSKISPKLLVITVGHGGIKEGQYMTPGKRSKDLGKGVLPEGQFNRLIGAEIVFKMYMQGYPVHLINPENEDTWNSTKVKRVNALCDKYGRNNVFGIDLHSNYADNPKAHGYEIFSSLGETGSDKIGNEIFYPIFRKHFPEKHFRVNTKADPTKDKKFTIVTGTKCRYLLLENFFNLSNILEYEEALDPCHRERIVDYICDCLIQVYKILG